MKVNPTWHSIHPDFKLNGVSCSRAELSEIGYSLIKEGQTFENSIGDFLLDWISDTPTVDVFTSGSTGKPKKITLKKEHMVNSASATAEYLGLTAGDRSLLCLSCSSIAGKMMLVRAMVLGLELDYVEPSSAPLAFTHKPYDFVALVPLQAEKSISQLSQIDTIIIGGAPISTSLRKALEQSASAVFETYGMTETITHIAMKKIGNDQVGSSTVKTYFKTLPNISVSQDARNCLVINAPKISDSKIVTNDIVELMDDSNFKWLGRYDSVINSGGIKLIPEQIEAKLEHMVNCRFFVMGIPDEMLGQKLILILEGEDNDISRLHQKIKTLKELDKFEIPKEIHTVPSFIETKSGKVDRIKTTETLFG
ncbi:AMP-binding protein [Flagellimonas sp. HMM57]|uniref:AMP-binding protein n=1 Tax=unclassified Flagellimonas TaxID=2644544 RepID=UPI0013D64D3F|nr:MULTISPECIES: AMP-binding protein [unclassified Flagellimonas]UII76033.1 AMP-binding protein [Flagellimonas sp. HMM57]